MLSDARFLSISSARASWRCIHTVDWANSVRIDSKAACEFLGWVCFFRGQAETVERFCWETVTGGCVHHSLYPGVIGHVTANTRRAHTSINNFKSGRTAREQDHVEQGCHLSQNGYGSMLPLGQLDFTELRREELPSVRQSP